MKFNEIFHLGVVVADLDKALRIYTEELGYGPFELGDGAFFADKSPPQAGYTDRLSDTCL